LPSDAGGHFSLENRKQWEFKENCALGMFFLPFLGEPPENKQA